MLRNEMAKRAPKLWKKYIFFLWSFTNHDLDLAVLHFKWIHQFTGSKWPVQWRGHIYVVSSLGESLLALAVCIVSSLCYSASPPHCSWCLDITALTSAFYSHTTQVGQTGLKTWSSLPDAVLPERLLFLCPVINWWRRSISENLILYYL